VAACPAGAITGTQFSNEQVFAQIEGLLMLDFSGKPVRRWEPQAAVAAPAFP
jgi:hypothetical protein